MKKIFILFLFSISQVFAQTNVYHTFPDSNAHWNIFSAGGCNFSFVGMQAEYTIQLSGDTNIQSINYHKLSIPTRKFTYSSNCPNPGIYYSRSEYVGAVRQDVNAKKVYIIPSNNTTEQLLYDFTMQVGDTLKGYLSALQNDVVVSIDSVLVGSAYRKRWVVNPCYQIYLIEGVGSTFGLIEKSYGCILDLNSYVITCFKQEGNTLYPSTVGTCETITDFKEVQNYDDKIDIRIENSMIYISTNQALQGFKLYDALGRILAANHEHDTTYMLNLSNYKGLVIFESIDKYGISAIRHFVINE